MTYSRRDFGKLALASLPAAALGGTSLFGQARPSSVFGGVQIGIITYSYNGMPESTAEATLRYVLDSGINAIELMDGPVEQYAGRPPAAGRGGGFGAIGGRGAGGAGRGAAGRGRGEAPIPGAVPADASFNGQPCSTFARGGGAGRAGGGRGAQVALTPEQIAEAQAAAQESARQLRDWRTSVSMDKFKAVRQMYNDAGVTIYAYKPDGLQKNAQTTDEEWDYVFTVASVLGATHLTMELPGGADAASMLRKIGSFAEKHKVYAAYHTHAQGTMTAFDEALAISPANMIAVDLGHYVAGGSVGGSPVQFLEKHHARTLSFHIKDRTPPERCGLNLAWGEGDTPLADILLAVKRNRWTNLIPDHRARVSGARGLGQGTGGPEVRRVLPQGVGLS